MDSRERSFISLDHQEPDRVPLDCWVSKGTNHKIYSKMQLSYDELLDKYDIDLRYIEGPEYIGPSLKTESGLETDIWGVSRKPVSIRVSDGTAAFKEVYQEVLESPLKIGPRRTGSITIVSRSNVMKFATREESPSLWATG